MTSKEKQLQELSRYIRGRLAYLGKTQTDLGRFMGVTQQDVSKKLKTHSYTARDLIYIFTYLDSDVEEIGRMLRAEK